MTTERDPSGLDSTAAPCETSLALAGRASTGSLLVAGRGPLLGYRCAWLGVLLSQLVLVALVRHPPLLDYPNHLARTYVLRHLDDVPAFHAAWIAAWRPLPNLAMDLSMLVLQRFFGIETAGRIFVGLTLLIGHVGCDRLGRALHGRPTWLAVGAQLLIFNTSLLHGFLNYAVGLGVFLLALAFWLPRRRTPTVPVLAGASLFALACYLSHLSAIVFLGLGVATYTLADLAGRRVGPRAAALAFVPFVAPAALLALVPHGHGRTQWPSIAEKVRALGWLFRAYSRPADVALAGLLLAAGALVWWGRAPAAPEADSTAAGAVKPGFGSAASATALVLAAVMALLYFACPIQVAGTWAADRRFIIPAAILALLAPAFELDRRAARAALGLVLATAVVRAVVIGRAWIALDARIEARCRVLRGIAPGSRVYRISTADRLNMTEQAFPHVLAYAAISNHAVVPLFSEPSQQPLLVRAPEPPAHRGGPWPKVGDVDWPRVFANHPYVWINDPDADYLAFLRGQCATVTEADGDYLASDCHT